MALRVFQRLRAKTVVLLSMAAAIRYLTRAISASGRAVSAEGASGRGPGGGAASLASARRGEVALPLMLQVAAGFLMAEGRRAVGCTGQLRAIG